MTEEEELEFKVKVGALASKIGQLLIQDSMQLPDCSFACGAAFSAILQAIKDKNLYIPEDPYPNLIEAFTAGLTKTQSLVITTK